MIKRAFQENPSDDSRRVPYKRIERAMTRV